MNVETTSNIMFQAKFSSRVISIFSYLNFLFVGAVSFHVIRDEMFACSQRCVLLIKITVCCSLNASIKQ